jgi:Leucine-rich repeat (LRR) protein
MTTSPPTTTEPTPNTSPRTTRHWLQFSLRTLLIVVALIAVAMGLLMRYVHQQRDLVRLEKEAVAEIEKLGGSVDYADHAQPVLPSLPSWLQAIIGEEKFRPVSSIDLANTKFTEANLINLKKLTAPKILLIYHTKFNDADLAHVCELNTLEGLNLSDTHITSEGLVHLSKLKVLKSIDLCNRPITDAGIMYLSNFDTLQSLDLSNTLITDASLEHLSKLTSLEWVSLRDTQITSAGAAKLQAALPNCLVRKP